MEVEACMNQKFMAEDSDDDETPLIFTRRNPNSITSGSKASSSIRPDKNSGKSNSNVVRTFNDRDSSSLKGKVISSSKTLSSSKPTLGGQKSPPLSSKLVKSPPLSTRPSPSNNKPPSLNGTSSVNHKSKNDVPVKEQKSAPILVKEEKSEKNMIDEDSDDSDDDKPLSARCSLRPVKGTSNASNVEVKCSESDSDDDKPISVRIDKGKAILGSSQSQKMNVTSKNNSNEEKPLKSKLHQNGTVKRETPSSLVKRPSLEGSFGQSSVKKAKISDSGKANFRPVKTGSKDYDDHIPIIQRLDKNASSSKSVPPKKVDKVNFSKLKINKNSKTMMKKSKYSKSSKELPNSGDGQKWTTLVHNGVIFPPPYQPHGVKMRYNGKEVDLTPEQEEVATMYAVMLDTDYVKKDKFNENFFKDWKKLLGKNHVIQDLSKCDFTPIYEWHLSEKEKKKQMSSEEKKAKKEEKLKQEEKYMWAILDGVKEKVGNFRVEPPGLFRGRGEHPKMGKLKKRIYPEDITINIGRDAPIPECPIPGQRWKEVRHDNTVTWLAYWNDPINPKEFKYVFLAASSSLKGQSDKEKYEKARKLKDYIEGIRSAYTKDFTSKDLTRQQVAVATYLIDRLALRAGNEKDEEEADTVGCCTLKVENVTPKPPNILEFDFLGKDSIKYYKLFEADPRVYKAVEKFRQGKEGTDDLFDMLDTSKLNAHLKELMPGLTAKVFRTFNASFTLDDMLAKGAGSGEVPEKIAIYQHANKEVAIICNHQRSVSKSHTSQMERLQTRIDDAKAELKELEEDLARAKKGKPPLKDSNGKQKRNLSPEAIEKKILSTKARIDKFERDKQSKEDLKEIALGTSKINYLDPRITVAWCKRNEVPIEKMFNKSLLAKFAWAMDCDPSFRF